MALLPIQAVVRYPTQAQAGVSYLMTVDLEFDPQQPTAWTLNREEIALECHVSSTLFAVSPPSDPTFILHRYGGTYGNLTFLLKARATVGNGEIHLTLFENDLPIGDFALATQVVTHTGAAPSAQVGYVETTARPAAVGVEAPPDDAETTTEQETPIQGGGERRYINFDLLIEDYKDNYRARVFASPFGDAIVDFILPFTGEELRAFFPLSNRIYYRNLRPNDANIGGPSRIDPKQFGARLYNAAFAGAVGLLLQRSLDEIKRQDTSLRIRLHFGSSELADLPWEYLYLPDLERFLALSERTPVTRYIETPIPETALQVAPPLRILVVVSNPSDMTALNVKDRWARLQNALTPQETSGLLVLERLNRGTFSALQQSLRQPGVHILHFMGHGFFTPEQNQGGLVFENEEGQAHLVEAERLAALLHDHASLRLLFLDAYEGAHSDRSDSFLGVARRLVQQGLPAVIAMQFAVSDRALLTLLQEFYRAIFDGFPVDIALTKARKALYLMGNESEWGAPVLFSRSEANILSVLSSPSPDQESERQPFEPETILIPTGHFLMGSQPGNDIPAHETPQHEVFIPDYLVGRYPVTNAQYAEFLKRNPEEKAPQQAGWFNRQPPKEKINHPVVGVCWHDVRAYCAWLSQETGRDYRLPTEAEWEKAAHGPDSYYYPWGNTWNDGRCNVNGRDTTPVDAYPGGASPYGCLDMLGNVAEWTNTRWGSDLKPSDYPYPYRVDDGREADEPNSQTDVYRIHRGGSFRSRQNEVRCAARSIEQADESNFALGFRVARSLDR